MTQEEAMGKLMEIKAWLNEPDTYDTALVMAMASLAGHSSAFEAAINAARTVVYDLVPADNGLNTLVWDRMVSEMRNAWRDGR